MTRAFLGLTLGTACIVGLLAIVIAAFFVTVPDVRTLKGCITTEQHKVHLCEQDANYVPLDQISPNIVGAIIMSEDASFYFHQGLDYKEMKESLIKDINEERFARGASTITQQLAKNVFLTSDKNITRKILEMYLALQIEKIFTKGKILAMYLNVVEFGPNLFGIKQACKYYFNTLPIQITPEQAAFLAFLLPNPSKYRQSYVRKKLTPFAESAVRIILHKMLFGRKIQTEEYQNAIARIPEFPWRVGPPDGDGQDALDLAIQDNAADFADEANQEGNEFKFDFAQ